MSCFYGNSKNKNSVHAVARKGKPGSTKDKVSASPTKQTVLGFFDNKGKVYINYVPRGTTVNADYIVGVLRKCLKALHQK